MNLVKTFRQFNENNIFFYEPIKNNILDEASFIKIIYSNNNVSLNGIYLLVNFKNIICEKYYNKYKINFNIKNNKKLIDDLKNIEEEILKKYNINKLPQFKLYELLNNGNIKILNEIKNDECNLVLKISGLWENSINYGLTFKFLNLERLSV